MTACAALYGAWLLALGALIVSTARGHRAFLRFCHDVARRESREDEYRWRAMTDNIATNAFLREQFMRLLRGDYRYTQASALAVQARSLRKKIIIQSLGLVLLLAALAVSGFCRCP